VDAARKAAKSKQAAAVVHGPAKADPEQFAAWLLAKAPEEDIAAYRQDVLAHAAERALAALKRHRKGEAVISIESDAKLERQERPVTAITLVNDNMPFLFDSILGEINDFAGEIFLVMHPVLLVRHGADGVAEILGEAPAHKGEPAGDRVSLIHVHVERLPQECAEALRERLAFILTQVRAAVGGWKPMLARLEQAISAYRYSPTPLPQDAVDEAIAFLEWLRDENFTFLGMREYRYAGGEKSGRLERIEGAGLGILADPSVRVLRGSGDSGTITTPEVRAFLHGPEPLIVTKANAKSLVHRRAYLDYIGVKTFDKEGKLAGELRIVGLFTSTAYTRSVLKIPYLRSKAQTVIAKSGFNPADHSGKALINVLESYPRDELFQISVPTLRKHAHTVLALGERPRVRALVRVDQFDRFVSVIVFVPRDRYDSRVRQQIGEYLKTVFEGRISAYYPAFPEGGLARVHFIIGRSGGKTPKVEPQAIEDKVREITRTWEDALRQLAAEAGHDRALTERATSFPEAYRSSFPPADAIRDAACIEALSAGNPIAIDLRREAGQAPEHAGLKIYHHGEPVALSRRVPLLENMGFRVISERTFEIDEGTAAPVFLHDMELESAFGKPIDLSDGGALFEEVFLATWRGQSDNDGYNALVQTASLRVSQIVVLRAYGRYLQQAGIPQSQDFIAAALNRYPHIAKLLDALFVRRFGPEQAAGDAGGERAKAIELQIAEALEAVPSLDDDTIIRRFLSLIEATVRTNHFAPPAERRSLAIKLDPRAVTGLPEPRPWREIFVYGPEVEGVHLRFGPVARGGLRWSDRAQDYRTEVLGLVKAQQVKNAVIVPVGAKGGFSPKLLPQGGSRDAVFEAGKAAYVNFVTSLLSVTDNLQGETVVPPEGVVRHDGDDPYFVVAADKGTATFSDTANAISQAHDFWLDDAFASGGSAGYDHKKMGITARGAWEAVKRHFREMNRDIQTQPFSVAGIGDMSGDVFGNGMLLSKEIRLVAAFDHRDIFIDPHPDPAASFAERERLFNLPRSSWQDYDRSKISEGGGVFPRSQKAITLSQTAAAAIGRGKLTATPFEIMTAILKAPVDLFWFGGIGTYVRASTETNTDVGDRANDLIRISAAELGAKVVGEGANLGMTQRARIEYGLLGGRCNTDAIDNSGGVNSSDVEVNIKIALAQPMRQGQLARPARNKLLAEMTEEVAGLVLANNYRQTLALSLAEKRGMAELGHQSRFMNALEARGLLDRTLETLPSDAVLIERQARGEPLTRAEIAVLLAYAKIVLFSDLTASGLLDDPHLEADLLDYFPDRMANKFRAGIEGHRLRREIIATQLANDAINRGGPSFVTRLQDVSGAAAAEVVRAFVIVRDGFGLGSVYAEIDALDNRIDGQVQLDLYQELGTLVHGATAWFLKDGDHETALPEAVARLRDALKRLEPKLPTMLPPLVRQAVDSRAQSLKTAGAPAPLAERLAMLGITALVPEIALVARAAGSDPVAAAKVFFAVTDRFRIGRIEDAARSITPADYYDGLALGRAMETIGQARRGIAVSALTAHGGAGDPVEAWTGARGDRVARTRDRLTALTESGEITVSRLAVAAGLMGDLAGS
jgi:glutamate dehydrogenase